MLLGLSIFGVIVMKLLAYLFGGMAFYASEEERGCAFAMFGILHIICEVGFIAGTIALLGFHK